MTQTLSYSVSGLYSQRQVDKQHKDDISLSKEVFKFIFLMSILLLITVDVVYYCSHWVIYLYIWHYYSVALLAVAFYVVYITLGDVESPTPNYFLFKTLRPQSRKSFPCF